MSCSLRTIHVCAQDTAHQFRVLSVRSLLYTVCQHPLPLRIRRTIGFLWYTRTHTLYARRQRYVLCVVYSAAIMSCAPPCKGHCKSPSPTLSAGPSVQRSSAPTLDLKRSIGCFYNAHTHTRAHTHTSYTHRQFVACYVWCMVQ